MQTAFSSLNDQNFDGLVEHFENNIYGSIKGRLRLKLIKQDLLQQIPQLSTKKLKILDVAAGLGQIAIWLAEMGHQVVIADISKEMIARSKQLAKEAKVEKNIQWIHSPLQNLKATLNPTQNKPQFNLIIAHAVLEWMAKPEQGFQAILQLASKRTQLSLSFYNLQGVILHNLLRGNFRKVQSGQFSGELGGLTPLNPLNPSEVRNWITNSNLSIQKQTGLRCFYDYLPLEKKRSISEQDIFTMEQKYSAQQPFIDMARYIHIVTKK